MDKIFMEPKALIYPRIILLVGSIVDNKPNIMTAGMSGVANLKPPMISVAIQHQRYTLQGIKQNKFFSVNLPSVDFVEETDFCGIVSGTKVDKIKLCEFNIFYDKSGYAPLIEQCPINLACKVEHILDLGSHSFIIGKVTETYVSENCLNDGEIDLGRMNLFSYSGAPDRQYLPFGKPFAKAHSAGSSIKIRNNL